MKERESRLKINDYLYLGGSKIHSNGLFAAKDIPKGTRVIQYTGELISKEEGNRRQEEYEQRSKSDPNLGAVYIFDIDDETDLDGTADSNFAKNINHSCDPNCKYVIKGKEVWIVSLRKIKKGEEITFNYGFEWDPKDYKDFPCKCGSKNCVGYILEKKSWKKLPSFKKKGKK